MRGSDVLAPRAVGPPPRGRPGLSISFEREWAGEKSRTGEQRRVVRRGSDFLAPRAVGPPPRGRPGLSISFEREWAGEESRTGGYERLRSQRRKARRDVSGARAATRWSARAVHQRRGGVSYRRVHFAPCSRCYSSVTPFLGANHWGAGGPTLALFPTIPSAVTLVVPPPPPPAHPAPSASKPPAADSFHPQRARCRHAWPCVCGLRCGTPRSPPRGSMHRATPSSPLPRTCTCRGTPNRTCWGSFTLVPTLSSRRLRRRGSLPQPPPPHDYFRG